MKEGEERENHVVMKLGWRRKKDLGRRLHERDAAAAVAVVVAAAAAAAAAEAETEIYLRGLLLPPLFYFGGGFGENGRSKICQFLYYLKKE